jgi:hypothetical protein
MKKLFCLSLLLIFTKVIMGQDIQPPIDSIANYFKELKIATEKSKQLWNRDLYGAVMLINPETRQVFTNMPDLEKELILENGIYTGYLPEKMGLANSAITWNGTTWATVMFPMSPNKNDRINIMAHELFHTFQPELGFVGNNTICNHLDIKEGRIYMRLEMEALLKAIQTNSENEIHKHITNALTFRAYRHTIFPESKVTENEQELLEGLAEYTGEITCERSCKDRVAYFIESIHNFFQYPTFVRSFAYKTIPIYGYFLFQNQPQWTLEINNNTQLTDYLISAFRITIPANLQSAVETLMVDYDGSRIVKEEVEREENLKKIVEEYKNRFITNLHFEIQLEQMQIFFDPGNMMPLEDEGTVYPTMYLTDKWGNLNVTNGALLSPDWRKVTLSIPTKIEVQNIEGDGWLLELTDGFSIEKGENGNYYLKRK